MSNDTLIAILPLVGVVLGAFLSQNYRKRNRVEIYSEKIFEKVFNAHQKLYDLIQSNYTAANTVIENSSLTYNERKEMVSQIVSEIATYCDKNSFYLDPYLSAQTVGFWMGVEDIQKIKSHSEKEIKIEHFRKQYASTLDIIKSESGLTSVKKHFKSITKSNINTTITKEIKRLLKKRYKTKKDILNALKL